MSDGDAHTADEPFDWASAIETLRSNGAADVPVIAETYIDRAGTGGSEPQIWKCDDDHEYYVKHRNNPQDRNHGTGARVPTLEQVLGRLAQRLSAPCQPVRIVNVPQTLIDTVDLKYRDGTPVEGGLAHGSRAVAAMCADGAPSPDVQALAENRERLARLRVMYAWFFPQDQQWLVEVNPPRLVHSVDHGLFAPGAPGWSAATVAQAATIADNDFFPHAALTDDDLRAAFAPISDLDRQEIAAAVAIVPASWDVPISDLVALAAWLWSRYEQVRAKWGSI